MAPVAILNTPPLPAAKNIPGADTTTVENSCWDDSTLSTPSWMASLTDPPAASEDTASSGYEASSSSASEEDLDEDDAVLGEFLWDVLGGYDPNLDDLTDLCV